MAPHPSIRISGGTPNGFPDFNPINPWGRRPPTRSYVSVADRKLCQIIVMWAGKRVPIGPRAPRDFCERLLVAINGHIATGQETVWSEPEIVEV